MSRERMGPPASEPEQRNYRVTVIERDGRESVSIVRHVHALDAARELASDLGMAGPRQEYVGAGGQWCIKVAGYELRAVVDTPHERVSRFAAAFPGSAAPRSSRVTDARDGTDNDERAATQRRIADAIRSVPDDARECATESILHGRKSVAYAEMPLGPLFLAALAACAKHSEILDAVRQVAQVHRLQDREDEPTEGG